jgi:hypothetical protein
MPGRWIVDESRLDYEASRDVGFLLLRWAAEGADGFVVTLDTSVYADPQQIPALLGAPASEGGLPGAAVVRGGAPPPRFAELVTDRSLLSRSVSGDLTNVETLELSTSGRRRYLAADYGRTQLLDLVEDEVSWLRSQLSAKGHDESLLIEAPALRR